MKRNLPLRYVDIHRLQRQIDHIERHILWVEQKLRQRSARRRRCIRLMRCHFRQVLPPSGLGSA